jgi:hypothetical protein
MLDSHRSKGYAENEFCLIGARMPITPAQFPEIINRHFRQPLTNMPMQ